MRKRDILQLFMLVVGLYNYSYAEKNQPYKDWQNGWIWSDSETPKFRKPAAYELETTKKLTVAFDQFFKVLDEENRKKGISRRYVVDTYGKVPEYNEEIDMIPIWVEEPESTLSVKPKNMDYLTKEQVNKMVDTLDREQISKIAKDFDQRIEYRLYFGNGNKINDLVFKDAPHFEGMKQEDKKIKYLVDGKYELFTQNDDAIFNSLGITEEEYKDNFLDKNGERVSKNNPKLVKFIKSKFEALGVDVKEKDGELYINKGGKDRRVLWNAYTISIPKHDYVLDKSIYQNTLLTKVLLFEEFKNKDEIVYTDDGNIVIKDVLNDDEIRFNGKKLDNSTEGNSYSELSNDYLEMKNNRMSKEEFHKKWKFTDDSYEAILNPVKVLNDKIENNSKLLEEKIEYLGGKGSWSNSTIYYDYFDGWYSSVKKAIEDGTDKRVVKFIQEKGITLGEFRQILEDIKDLTEKNDEFKNTLDELKQNIPIKRFSTADLSKYISGKKEVMLAGQGRIDGVVDLGHGYNILSISENEAKYSGKYGTNITFGPYAKLKNVDVVGIGRQENSTLGSSGLSGISSMTIEVDPNKYNSDGNLYQHVLKDTWEPFGKKDENGKDIKPTRVVFRKYKGFGLIDDYRNDFTIYLKTSDIGKNNTVIDMGRPLEYRDDFDNYQYKINLTPDSLAQELVNLDEKSSVGNSLVKVKFKERIYGLNENENKIYQSMVNSGELNALNKTLTTTNKKTIFTTPESDKVERDKNLKLALYLKDKDKTSDSIISDLADFEIVGKNKDSLNEKIKAVKDNIIKDSFTESEKRDIDSTFSKLEKYRGMSKTLKKYKQIDTTGAKNDILKVVNEFGDIREDIQNIRPEEITKRFGSREKVEEKVEELKKIYSQNIEKLYNEIVAAKPDTNKGEEEINIKIPLFDGRVAPGSAMRGYGGYGGLANLKNPYGSTPEEQLLQLVSSYRLYNNIIDWFNQLKEEYIDATMLTDLQREELFKQIRVALYYTQRETEALNEFKIVLDQLYQNNIYAKVNKISKNSLDELLPQIIDNKFDFTSKKNTATGGAISGRYAKDKFKGTIYTGYGIYEAALRDNLSAGFVVSGTKSDFKEILNDNIKTVTTESKVHGTAAYVGTFGRYNIKNNLDWINGLGIQYAKYDVDRDMKNNYQQKKYKGKLNTYSGNIYSALNYKYKINDTLDVNLKTGISYTTVNQGKVKENKEPLSIEVNSQQFNYLDGQAGVGLSKTIYDGEITSRLSGGVYTIYGISGYENSNLKGRFAGSTSDFDIKGESYNKESVKIKLDYEVEYATGLNYGISGSYIKNADEDNISIGVKAGYRF